MSYSLPNLAFIGRAGAGKSTAAQILVEEFHYWHLSFAAPLKDVAEQLWGPDARTDRGKLQQLGVAVRDIVPDTWADLLAADIARRSPTARIVVDDCRFENEVWKLAESGFVFVRIVASHSARVARLQANGKLQDESQLDHESETQLDGLKTKYILGNDTGGLPLRQQVIEVLNQERR